MQLSVHSILFFVLCHAVCSIGPTCGTTSFTDHPVMFTVFSGEKPVKSVSLITPLCSNDHVTAWLDLDYIVQMFKFIVSWHLTGQCRDRSIAQDLYTGANRWSVRFGLLSESDAVVGCRLYVRMPIPIKFLILRSNLSLSANGDERRLCFSSHMTVRPR